MSSDSIVEFYSQPQLGGGFPVFQGSRRQIGGSFLSSLARFALPILKFLGKKVVGVASNVASDVIDKKISLRESIPKRAKEGVMDTLRQVQAGRGRKRKGSIQNYGLKKRRSIHINTLKLPPNALFST